MDDVVSDAVAAFSAKLEAVENALREIAARTADERLRDTAQRQLKHPLQSSTTLKETKRRAQGTLAKLEAESATTIKDATSALLAIAFAKAFIARVDEAISNDADDDLEKAKTGLFKEVRQAVETIYELGADKWHWGQQSLSELIIYSDLIRWKAKSPNHDDPLSPWSIINEIYAQRRISIDLIGKRSRSVPKDYEAPRKIKGARSIAKPPSNQELDRLLAGWGSRFDFPDGARTEGIGLVPGDDQFGGYVCQFIDSVYGFTPINLRTGIGPKESTPLQPKDWNRIEMPRSVYALVSLNGEYPQRTYPQMYPPYGRMRHVGVDLEIDSSALRELEDAEAGEGKPSLLIEATRASFLKYNRCHDEDLIRFWLFLLVGRRYPERVDQLFPNGYFHGVLGPDIGDGLNGKTHLQVVRVASDREYGHMMRHPDYGPWSKL